MAGCVGVDVEDAGWDWDGAGEGAIAGTLLPPGDGAGPLDFLATAEYVGCWDPSSSGLVISEPLSGLAGSVIFMIDEGSDIDIGKS